MSAKEQPPQPPLPPSEEPGLTSYLPLEELEKMSTLQLLDLVGARMSFLGMPSLDHQLLRQRVEEMEEVQDQAREALENLSEALDKLRSPALRVGTLLALHEDGTAMALVGGGDYVCNLDPDLDPESLTIGMQVTLNEAFAITGCLELDLHGPILKVQETLADGRLRLGQDNGMQDLLVPRGRALADVKIRVGDEVRLDMGQRLAIEILPKSQQQHSVLTEVPETPWSAIGE